MPPTTSFSTVLNILWEHPIQQQTLSLETTCHYSTLYFHRFLTSQCAHQFRPCWYQQDPVGTQSLRELDRTVQLLFSRDLASSTSVAYDSGKHTYLIFCSQYQLQPLPLSEITLCHFVACLHSSNKAVPTICTNLSALRYMQIENGLPDPSPLSFPHLKHICKGIHRNPSAIPRAKCLPVRHTCYSSDNL